MILSNSHTNLSTITFPLYKKLISLISVTTLIFLASCSESVKFSSTRVHSEGNFANNDYKKSIKDKASKQNSNSVTTNTSKLGAISSTNGNNEYKENHFNPFKPVPKTKNKIIAENQSELTEFGEKIIFEGNKWLGTPYQYGGNSYNGVDCSALTQNVYKQSGYDIPRTAAEQYEYCNLIEPENRQVGDLVFFAQNTSISHVGIYAGNNEVIHASTSQGVIQQSIFSSFLYNNFVSFGRLPKFISNN